MVATKTTVYTLDCVPGYKSPPSSISSQVFRIHRSFVICTAPFLLMGTQVVSSKNVVRSSNIYYSFTTSRIYQQALNRKLRRSRSFFSKEEVAFFTLYSSFPRTKMCSQFSAIKTEQEFSFMNRSNQKFSLGFRISIFNSPLTFCRDSCFVTKIRSRNIK